MIKQSMNELIIEKTVNKADYLGVNLDTLQDVSLIHLAAVGCAELLAQTTISMEDIVNALKKALGNDFKPPIKDMSEFYCLTSGGDYIVVNTPDWPWERSDLLELSWDTMPEIEKLVIIDKHSDIDKQVKDLAWYLDCSPEALHLKPLNQAISKLDGHNYNVIAMPRLVNSCDTHLPIYLRG